MYCKSLDYGLFKNAWHIASRPTNVPHTHTRAYSYTRGRANALCVCAIVASKNLKSQIELSS